MPWISGMNVLLAFRVFHRVEKSRKIKEIRKAGGNNPTQDEDTLNKTIYKCWKICSFIIFFFLGSGPSEMEVFRKQWSRIPGLGLELPSSSQVSVGMLRNTALTSVKLLKNPIFPKIRGSKEGTEFQEDVLELLHLLGSLMEWFSSPHALSLRNNPSWGGKFTQEEGNGKTIFPFNFSN